MHKNATLHNILFIFLLSPELPLASFVILCVPIIQKHFLTLVKLLLLLATTDYKHQLDTIKVSLIFEKPEKPNFTGMKGK